MGKKNKNSNPRKPHCLVLPLPTQIYADHMIQFSKRLRKRGINVTLVLTRTFFKSLKEYSSSKEIISLGPIKIISDGSEDDEGLYLGDACGISLTRFKRVGSQDLTQLLKTSTKHIDCVVYSSFLPWALDVANSFGLVGAAFFSHPSASGYIYYHVHEGRLTVPLETITKRGSSSIIQLDGLPPLEPATDIPSHISDIGRRLVCTDKLNLFVNQFSNVGGADWLFCNTFYELEKRVVDKMEKQWRFRTIGPHYIPNLSYKRLQFDNKEYACIKWLKKQADGSVVFVSVSHLNYEQMQELAWGIKGSNKHFLWEVKASVPEQFLKETSEQDQGLVVSTCPREEVILAQKSIGCFVTHCGWNSFLETISFGVPLVAMPQWSDQYTTAKYVEGVWKTGVRAQAVDRRIVKLEVVEHCIREVMEGGRAREMKRNAKEWGELARKAAETGGSSDRNIDEFVASLIHS